MGHPAPVTAYPRGTQTIEATGKPWKLCQLLGALGLITSVVWAMITGQSNDPGAALGFAILLGLLSLALFIVGRIGAWWFHG